MSYQAIETPKGEEHLSNDSRPQVQVIRKASTVAKRTPTALSPNVQEPLTNSTTPSFNQVNSTKSHSGLKKIKLPSFGSEPFERSSVQESAPKNDKKNDRLASDFRVSTFEGAENPVTPSIRSSQFKLPPRPSRLKPQLNQHQ